MYPPFEDYLVPWYEGGGGGEHQIDAGPEDIEIHVSNYEKVFYYI